MYEWLIYGALIASFVAVGIAAGRLVVRVSHTWRGFKRLRRQLYKELDHLDARGRHAREQGRVRRRHAPARRGVARLRVSLARLQVLRNALDEVQGMFRRVAFFLPRG